MEYSFKIVEAIFNIKELYTRRGTMRSNIEICWKDLDRILTKKKNKKLI